MRHRRLGRQLSRTREHRKALLRNLVTELFRRERIRTTTAKAKETRRVAERLITYAKRGGLARRRLAARYVQDKAVLQRLFDEVAPRFEERPGGYTRVVKLKRRLGDGGELAILELIGAADALAKMAEETEEKGEKKGKRKSEKVTKAATAKKTEKETTKKATKKTTKKKTKKKTKKTAKATTRKTTKKSTKKTAKKTTKKTARKTAKKKTK